MMLFNITCVENGYIIVVNQSGLVERKFVAESRHEIMEIMKKIEDGEKNE